MYVMGIDAGTQSIKVLVYDEGKRNKVAFSQKSLDLISKNDGTREQKVSWWIDALTACFDEIGREVLSKVKVLAISGQQHGFVPVAEDKSVLSNVKLWCDTSTVKECDEISNSFGGEERLIKEVGNPIMPGYTASKILYLKKHNEESFNKMRYVLLPHDYLNYYLTGIAVMEKGDASGTGLMTIKDGTWNIELCNIISPSLIDKLPKIVNPGIIGCVKDEIAERFGFNNDTLVATGGGDNMMAAIGTGCVEDGSLTISLGTSGTMFASSILPIIDDKNRLAAFRSSHNTYLPLLCTMNCTVASESVRKLFNLSAQDFDKLASQAPIGAEELVFLPFLNGERVPNLPFGEGVLGGMNVMNIKSENIARSVLEGVSYEFLLGLEAFKEKGFEAKVITLTGGGANSSFWRQMLCDMLSCSVRVTKEKEAAAFGAILQALWLIGDKDLSEVVNEHLVFDETKACSPNLDNSELYQKVYKKWKSYTDSLTNQFKQA